MDTLRTLAILADAAKHDVSCASSGSRRGGAAGAVGSTLPAGVCHSFTPDGRCISLFKVLLTNRCRHDCLYCPSRASSDTPRAAFRPEELARLTMGLYLRNCIEGLFLSSAVPDCADRAMERMLAVVKLLRTKHAFRGYIHLKAIPGASPELLAQAAALADRLSANLELPTPEALGRLAPAKDHRAIRDQMGRLARGIAQAAAEPRGPAFAPAGQSTQMVVGADASTDLALLTASARLYNVYDLRRVYYSAFSPVAGQSPALPARPAPLLREHRLYQADWLQRFYGFAVAELFDGAPASDGGMLDLEIEPKLAWALRHRGGFPVDVNRADREALLRVPGLGVRAVERILAARRVRRITVADLRTMRVPLGRALPFVALADHRPTGGVLEATPERARAFFAKRTQLLLPIPGGCGNQPRPTKPFAARVALACAS